MKILYNVTVKSLRTYRLCWPPQSLYIWRLRVRMPSWHSQDIHCRQASFPLAWPGLRLPLPLFPLSDHTVFFREEEEETVGRQPTVRRV